ncbi:hypothetical protein EN871_34565, partial [bacterium M00.F.Ca.ET.228.01.1.1]
MNSNCWCKAWPEQRAPSPSLLASSAARDSHTKSLIERNIGFHEPFNRKQGTTAMNSVIYLIGLIVVVLAVLSFL